MFDLDKQLTLGNKNLRTSIADVVVTANEVTWYLAETIDSRKAYLITTRQATI
jgi:hypothetical protein